MPQHNHINQLLSTAAAGNGVIGDVDALLTPLANTGKNNDSQNNSSSGAGGGSNSKERTERNLWRNDEVMEMLVVMQQTKALEKLNDKTVKSENVFKDVAAIMHKNGFIKKSHVQIWTKWKFLKSTYMTSRRNGVIPRMIPHDIYETIHQMITTYNQGMSECGTSTTASMDGDNSNAGHVSRASVDGGGPAAKLAGNDANQTGDNFDMAHPIFGFSLGLVKDEPTDTGYNAVENNKTETATENQLNGTISEKVQIPDKPTNTVIENQTKKTLEIPHRGRGRPPKQKILPAATSTPITTVTTALPNLQQMPPLRVAPFAKAPNSSNALAASRPPPPLTMPPSPRQIQIATIPTISVTPKISNNNNPAKVGQRKLLPKLSMPPNEIQNAAALRLLNDLQTSRASSASPSNNYPKLKQVPMRKTPYSLRPERLIPDLEESISPPRAELQVNGERFPQQIQQQQQQEGTAMISGQVTQNGVSYRKRRLDWSQQQRNTPTKFRKIPSDDEDMPVLQQPQPLPNQKEESRRYGKHLQNVIIDLSTNMRQIQTQMMREFFDKQHELLQKEHEFQMQQDRMIMETFQMQTYEIMKSVKELVGSIATRRNDMEEQHLNSQSNQELIEHEEFHNLGESHELDNEEAVDSQDGMGEHPEHEFSTEEMVQQEQEDAEAEAEEENNETHGNHDNEQETVQSYPENPDIDEQDGVQIQLQQHDEQMQHQSSQSQDDNESQENVNGDCGGGIDGL
ncbi:protein split ends-like, partial [Musca vetustissima]|uniref:protein split ends-like n=1 Tax=Musca vetustissima TaxID=27455 RepID=UPI002AB5E4D7